jgi:putative oxidoreductase
MSAFVERYRDHGLLLLRVGFGGAFIWYHGWPKLAGGPETWEQVGSAMGSLGLGFAPTFWGFMGAMAETVGAALIVVGLLFRPAALVLAFMMFVATLNHHVTGQGTPAHSFKNIWVFAGLVAIGPGRFSLDHLLARHGKGRPGTLAEADATE